MSGTLNKATIIGRLGKDPEVKTLPNGGTLAQMSLATEETWKDKQTGERKKRTEWHRVVCFNEHLCKVIGDYVRKGALIYIEGQIATRKWTDQSGAEKYTTEIILPKFGGVLTMLSSTRDGEGNQAPAGGGAGSARGAAPEDDNIPF